mmetsp:Transcript_66784/g.211383  ORF Transcript_66784/g.211383 Transcript_66784/m.211383 type:complete len:254 (-) Transcript_66784:487-1248(-)
MCEVRARGLLLHPPVHRLQPPLHRPGLLQLLTLPLQDLRKLAITRLQALGEVVTLDLGLPNLPHVLLALGLLHVDHAVQLRQLLPELRPLGDLQLISSLQTLLALVKGSLQLIGPLLRPLTLAPGSLEDIFVLDQLLGLVALRSQDAALKVLELLTDVYGGRLNADEVRDIVLRASLLELKLLPQAARLPRELGPHQLGGGFGHRGHLLHVHPQVLAACLQRIEPRGAQPRGGLQARLELLARSLKRVHPRGA